MLSGGGGGSFSRPLVSSPITLLPHPQQPDGFNSNQIPRRGQMIDQTVICTYVALFVRISLHWSFSPGLALLGAFRWLTSSRLRGSERRGSRGGQRREIPDLTILRIPCLETFCYFPSLTVGVSKFSEYKDKSLSSVHRTAVIFLACVYGQDA